MSIFIKDVELKNNVILSPMAGYSDVAFRHLCLSYGAGLVCTEMVSSKALHYHNKKTEELLENFDEDHPVAVQLFGHEPEIMAEAVKNPLLDKFDIIDINMGCPAPKIVNNGDGSALLKNFQLASDIISACVKVTSKPITVKFRIGFDDENIVAVEFAKMCERAGASAITVHGRTTKQGYSGNVDYETIKKVKNAVSIPVFANGDCRTILDKQNILKITGTDGVAIARAAVGRPEIFLEMQGKEVLPDKLEQIKYHYETLMKFYPERYVVKYMRSHLAGYLSGKYKNSKALVELMKLSKYCEIIGFLSKIIV